MYYQCSENKGADQLCINFGFAYAKIRVSLRGSSSFHGEKNENVLDCLCYALMAV